MKSKLKQNGNLQFLLIVIMALVVGISIFPPDNMLSRWGANHAVHSMFGFLFLALMFLVLRQKNLVFASFFSCFVLCIFLKNASNNSLTLPEKTIEDVFEIAQYNISSFNSNLEGNINSILDHNSELISFQEVTPDWERTLNLELKEVYPYHSIVYRMEDFLGIALYSKTPFLSLDTFYYEDIPNLAVELSNGIDDVVIISSFVYPEIISSDNEKVSAHFNSIKGYIEDIKKPVIATGDYNQVQWSKHLQDLKNSLLLQDSRRFQFFSNPTDHIFFTSHFNCVEFQTISNRFTNHLGIKGSYQLNRNFVDAQKTPKKF